MFGFCLVLLLTMSLNEFVFKFSVCSVCRLLYSSPLYLVDAVRWTADVARKG